MNKEILTQTQLTFIFNIIFIWIYLSKLLLNDVTFGTFGGTGLRWILFKVIEKERKEDEEIKKKKKKDGVKKTQSQKRTKEATFGT